MKTYLRVIDQNQNEIEKFFQVTHPMDNHSLGMGSRFHPCVCVHFAQKYLILDPVLVKTYVFLLIFGSEAGPL